MAGELRKMTREDWHHASGLLDEMVFDEPDSHEQCVWNMAIKAASMRLCQEGAAYPWADTEETVVSR
jgi:hypothetical protein